MRDFCELCSDQFNKVEFVSESKLMGGLRNQLGCPLDLRKKGNITMTQERVKSKLGTTKPKMCRVIDKYERSGNDCGERSDDSPGWGKFDLSLYTDGDDHDIFLQKHSTY